VGGATKNQEYAYKALEREFESTFINELMPGILHNFANPLNGIMGRSKLLQRRMDDYLKKIQFIYPDLMTQMGDEHNKLLNDVSSICKESDRFYYMFQELASKFYAIADGRFDQINLGKLLENELRFLEFYLDFKHDIKKTIHLMSDLPFIYGVHSDYSYCFSAIFRDSMTRMKKSGSKELYVGTEYENDVISVLVQDTGEKIGRNRDRAVTDRTPSPGCDADNLDYVQMLFKKYHVNCVFEAMADTNRITVEIPVKKTNSMGDEGNIVP